MSTRILRDGMNVEHLEGFIDRNHANELFEALRDGLPWGRPSVRTPVGPKSVPRLVTWIADPGVSYTYSGITQPVVAWTPAVLGVKTALEAHLQVSFNGCLGNYYQDRRDSIGKHADDERDLNKGSVIASVSFGGARTFKLRHAGLKKTFPFHLASGDLLVMSGNTQEVCQHWIDKEKFYCEPRINLTFRQMRKVSPL